MLINFRKETAPPGHDSGGAQCIAPYASGCDLSNVSPIVVRLQAALTERGIPEARIRSAIADAAGITAQSAFHWFNGRTKTPRADALALVARHYDIDLCWLILGD